ncbi:MAG: hypothetical protein ABH827_02520 [bacterium]
MRKILLGLAVIGALTLCVCMKAMAPDSAPEQSAAAEQQSDMPDMKELEQALQQAMEQAGVADQQAGSEHQDAAASVPQEEVAPVMPVESSVPTMPGTETKSVIKPEVPATSGHPVTAVPVEPAAPVMPGTQAELATEPAAPVMPGTQAQPATEPMAPVSMPGLE